MDPARGHHEAGLGQRVNQRIDERAAVQPLREAIRNLLALDGHSGSKHPSAHTTRALFVLSCPYSLANDDAVSRDPQR